ncbi:MAG: hypothetical protein AAGF83_27415 [Cyanobacteria bacterium P01_G01_bin.67]
MIELLYFASQIQCGTGGEFLDIQVNVYQNQELVETMVVEDRVLLPVDSVSDLTFEYSVINNDNDTSCSSLAAPSELVLAPDDELPNLAGFDQQDSVISLLSGLNEYQELFLVELGTTDTASSAFDMQDVTLRIDNNPVISLFAD